MLKAPILYVGEDVCRRIPVFERFGAIVRRIPCSARELRDALSVTVHYSAITFNQDVEPLTSDVLNEACCSPSPLVLFENPTFPYDPARFDLIIQPHTFPSVWLKCIKDTIADSRKLREQSKALREDVAAVRAESQKVQSRLQRLVIPIDVGDIWRMDWSMDITVAPPPPKKDTD